MGLIWPESSHMPHEHVVERFMALSLSKGLPHFTSVSSRALHFLNAQMFTPTQ